MKFTAVLAALATAVAFEAQAVLATQDKTVRAVSPWQDDPYDAFVSFALVAVPPLVVVIAGRLPLWRAPGGPDRQQQTARAAGALTGLVGLTLAAEWAAVGACAHSAVWSGRTTALIAGLAGQTILTAAVAGTLWLRRAPRGTARGWRHDWLGDVVLLAGRVPLARRWATPHVAVWVRGHTTGVFAAASLLAGIGVIGAQALGEGWTDPLLIGWAVTVVATSMFAFSVATNAVAGFITRPARTRTARTAEAAVLAGSVALSLMTAIRDSVWTAVTGRPVGSVLGLVCLTVGAGLAASALTAAVLVARSNGDTG
ncbi:hypothetical protein Dvina_51260 [Dactylosporangium vinaceum]|uniref:Uncharacterized protein n=1 Tax=Dactylosporangium vinaceum TaxID=53362 RepID=A0ABV5M2B4_9ACTN|nr:hypothetical protein [Dactylosporangium vinaceum]UAB96228.1 hypothetical protein Dvina_51260 [Dactylosporangium vinaceum]